MSIPTYLRSTSFWQSAAAVLLPLTIAAGGAGQAAVLVVAVLAGFAGFVSFTQVSTAKSGLVKLLGNTPSILIILMLIAWLPNLLNTPTLGESVKTWFRISLVIATATVLYVVIASSVEKAELCHKSLLYFTSSVLAISIFAIVVFPDFVIEIRNSRSDAWFRYKAFASSIVCLIPFMLWMAFTQTGPKRYTAIISIVCIVAFVFGTSSRSSLAGLAAILCGFLLISGLRKPKLRIPTIFGILMILIAISAYLMLRKGSGGTQSGALGLPLWMIDFHRQHIWAFVLDNIDNTLWTGYGINAIANLPGATVIIPNYHDNFLPSHPHNWMLEILSETGLIGFVPCLILVLYILLKDLALSVLHGSGMHTVRFCTSVAFWTSSCFNFSIWAPWWGISYLFIFVIVSLMDEKPIL